MLSKEEIRNKWIYHTPLKLLPECVDAAMDEYAAVWKQKAEWYEKALKEVYAQLDDKDIPMATRFLNAGQIIEITLNNSNK